MPLPGNVYDSVRMFIRACSSAQDQQDNVILRWNTTTLQAIADTRSVPTVAARALAIVNTSIYNAWAAYDPIAMPTLRGVTLRSPEPDLSKKSVAISFAAYHALFDLLPSDTSLFNNEMESLGLDPNATSSDVLTPASIGTRITELDESAVLESLDKVGLCSAASPTYTSPLFATFLRWPIFYVTPSRPLATSLDCALVMALSPSASRPSPRSIFSAGYSFAPLTRRGEVGAPSSGPLPSLPSITRSSPGRLSYALEPLTAYCSKERGVFFLVSCFTWHITLRC